MTKTDAMRMARTITASVPRVKGLGRLLALVATYFRRQRLPDIEVAVLGRKMLLNPNDLIGNCLIFTPQYFDPRERRVIAKILREGDYVVDVGANVGGFSLIFADLVGPSGLVTAIEAEQNNAERLRHNLKINSFSWVNVHQRGVSDRDESLSLLLNSTGNAGGHSFYEQSDTTSPPIQRVACHPLSALVENGRTPRFMKLDIEGFEHRVLKRYFEDVAARVWPEFIMLEDNESRREADAVQLVLSKGYTVMHRFDANVFFVR